MKSKLFVMNIRNIWQDFLQYLRYGFFSIKNELFQIDLPHDESLYKLPTIKDKINDENERQRQEREEKLQAKYESDLSKGDKVVEETVLQIISNVNKKIDGNENKYIEQY